MSKQYWHSLDGDEVLVALEALLSGLSSDEANARQDRYGPHQLPAPPRQGALRRFLLHFQNV